MEETQIAQAEALKQFGIDVLKHLRVPDRDAAIIADSINLYRLGCA